MGNVYNEEYMEFDTFMITMSDGKEQECAIVDEFDFEGKHYVVGALIKEDTILDENLYIYQSIIEKDSFRVEKIKREFDYNRIAQAYMHMDE